MRLAGRRGIIGSKKAEKESSRMDWMEEIREKARRKNDILIAKDGVCLRELRQRLEGQDHRAVVLWALELAEEDVKALEDACPGEHRPRLALVHTSGHALGLPMYELTALVRRYGLENCREAVEQRRQQYLDRLAYWQAHWQEDPGPWAAFLCR